MNAAKFEIGQRVIVRSKKFPEINVDDAVVESMSPRRVGDEVITNGGIIGVVLKDYWLYSLSSLPGKMIGEMFLFPRPDAGDDFCTMMDKLKQGEGVKA